MKNPILLEKEKSWGQTETPITRRKSPLIATIIKISSIGVLCTFFVRAIFRATLASGHVGDTVLMIMRLFLRHVFSMKLSPCWYGCGKKNVEILGYKVTLFLRYERVTVSLSTPRSLVTGKPVWGSTLLLLFFRIRYHQKQPFCQIFERCPDC